MYGMYVKNILEKWGWEIVDEIHPAKNLEPLTSFFEHRNEQSGFINLKNS